MQACIANSALQPSVSAGQACRPARQARCMAQAGLQNQRSDRRSAGLMLVAFPALLAAPAFARDADKAKAAAEARKEALAKAAEEMRESGKTASAFSESQYAVYPPMSTLDRRRVSVRVLTDSTSFACL